MRVHEPQLELHAERQGLELLKGSSGTMRLSAWLLSAGATQRAWHRRGRKREEGGGAPICCVLRSKAFGPPGARIPARAVDGDGWPARRRPPVTRMAGSANAIMRPSSGEAVTKVEGDQQLIEDSGDIAQQPIQIACRQPGTAAGVGDRHAGDLGEGAHADQRQHQATGRFHSACAATIDTQHEHQHVHQRRGAPSWRGHTQGRGLRAA